MYLIIISLIYFVYFFIAGFVLRHMLDEVKTGPSSWWPISGALLLSVFWLVLAVWALVNLFSYKTRCWYFKLASTIFEEQKGQGKKSWRESIF